MKSILKILVLGVVPILAATAVVDQGLASGKGSQLIFQADVDDKNFISVTNTGSKKAVTVLTQYYNDEMTLVLWYLRVITSGATVLVDPFDHEIPGTAKKDKDGKEMPGTATNVSEVLSALPAMTNEDDGPGVNSGRMVIAVTAVGANMVDDASTVDVVQTPNERRRYGECPVPGFSGQGNAQDRQHRRVRSYQVYAVRTIVSRRLHAVASQRHRRNGRLQGRRYVVQERRQIDGRQRRGDCIQSSVRALHIGDGPDGCGWIRPDRILGWYASGPWGRQQYGQRDYDTPRLCHSDRCEWRGRHQRHFCGRWPFGRN